MTNKFPCFRSFEIKTESESDGSAICFGDRTFTCITGNSIQDSGISMVKSPVVDTETSKCSENAIHRCSSSSSRKSSLSRSFSGVVRSMIFETSSRKKAPNSNPRKIATSSDTSKSPEIASTSIPRIRRSSSAPEKERNLTSKPHSSSLKQRKQSTNSPQKPSEAKSEKKVNNCSSSVTGLLLILIALSSTIFHGRICATLFTSTWLYLLSRQSSRDRKPGKVTMTQLETELPAKKRVVMEGLLERKYHYRGN